MDLTGKTILFIPLGPAHTRKNVPLLTALAQAGARIRVLCPDTALRFEQHTMRHIQNAGFVPIELPPVDFDPLMHWSGVLARRVLIQPFVDILKSERVDLVIVGTEVGIVAGAWIGACRKHNVLTVSVKDGLACTIRHLGQYDRFKARCSIWLREIIGDGGVGGRGSPDLTLHLSRAGAENLRYRGLKPANIAHVGSPEFDEFARHKASDEEIEAVRKTLHLEPGQKVILFAHQMEMGLDERAKRVTMGAMLHAAKQTHCLLVIKIHPRSTDHLLWQQVVPAKAVEAGLVRFIHNELVPAQMMPLTACCITFCSTVVVEALIAHVPVVMMQYHRIGEALYFGQKYGAALDAWYPADLHPLIIRAVSDPATRESLFRGGQVALATELYGVDGKSLQRILDAIEALIKRAPRLAH